jgi:hypothetical protein
MPGRSCWQIGAATHCQRNRISGAARSWLRMITPEQLTAIRRQVALAIGIET